MYLGPKKFNINVILSNLKIWRHIPFQFFFTIFQPLPKTLLSVLDCDCMSHVVMDSSCLKILLQELSVIYFHTMIS